MEYKRVLVAGATGYLGQYLVQEFTKRKYHVRVLIRKESQKEMFPDDITDFFVGEITNPNSLSGCCMNIDWVVSSVGITRQKDGLTYMDVDYQGNVNLLNEAKLQASSSTSSDGVGVESFLYVSAIGGDKLRQLKIFEAKERFVDELKMSGLKHTIVMRPNGFFSDMKDFLDMAQRGTVYLFGNGDYQFNPIHGADLAKVCVDTMIQTTTSSTNDDSGVSHVELTAGGPDMFTQNEVAALALKAWGKEPPRIVHLPDWIRKFTIWALRTFTSSTTYGPIEFFLTLMAMDNKAQLFGTQHLHDFFTKEVENEKNT